MHFVEAKGILHDSGGRCGMNVYRGCSHGCIYCDSRSRCYQFTHPFEDVEVKRNAAKECYRNLTHEYMESYIASHDNAASRRAEYSELRLLAECHSIRYPTSKRWFLATYPEVVQYGVQEATTQKVPLEEVA